MQKVETYRQELRQREQWIPYLLAESRLPGPRANLELAEAVAEEGDEPRFRELLAFPREQAGGNTPGVFVVCCGVIGLGKLAAQGGEGVLEGLRSYATDGRWRIREAVATALQRLGDANMDRLLAEMAAWSDGSWLEKRAVAAALAEPRLLQAPHAARQVLHIMDRLTASMLEAGDRRDEGFRILRQALGYAWSVAIAALPGEGLPLFGRWQANSDPDVQWVVRENLKKKRMQPLLQN